MHQGEAIRDEEGKSKSDSEDNEADKEAEKPEVTEQKVRRSSLTNVPRHFLKRKNSMKMNDIFGIANFIQQQQLPDFDHSELKKSSKLASSKIEEYNFYMHEKKYSFGKNSLFIFPDDNLIRKYCVWLITWHWFDKIITFVILLNTLSLIFQNYDFRVNGDSQASTLTLIRNNLEYVFTAIFLIEFILKVLAMGFIAEPSTYLRDGWNILDFAVVLTSLLSLAGSINLSAIRTIRILRPLRSIKSVPGLRILVASLLDSLPYLGNVVVFLLYLLIMFGILGLQLFSGAYELRCRLTPNPVNGEWLANTTIKRLCSSDSDCPDNNYCGDPSYYNLPFQGDPILGLEQKYASFDDILKSTFTIFQALTTEGWSSLTYTLSQAIHPAIVYIYFISLTLAGSFFTVNLILAVINDSFLKNQHQRKAEIFKEEQRRKAQKKEQKMKQKQSARVHPVDDLQENQEDSDSSDEEAQKKKQELIKKVLQPAEYIGRAEYLKKLQDQQNLKLNEKKKVNYFDPQLYTLDMESREKTSFGTEVRNMVNDFIESYFFLILVNMFILANTIVLSLDRYPEPKDEDELTNYINLGFTVFFFLELVLKLIALGFREYFRDGMNCFDCFIVIISLAEQILALTDNAVSAGSFTAVAAFRTLRIFRIFKLARAWSSFREILIAIGSTLEAIGLFTILLLLFMIISALVGMELFAYNVRGLRLNFDTFYEAMITIFTLLTNEAWNTTTYDYIESMGGWWPLVFFVVVVLAGNFILLKLFIAILIYNFGQSAIEAEKKLEEKAKKATLSQLISQLRSSKKDQNQNPDDDTTQAQVEEIKKKRKLNPNFAGLAQNSDIAFFFLAKYDQAKFEARKERRQKKMVQKFFESAKVIAEDEISDDSSDEELENQIETKFNKKIGQENASMHSASSGLLQSQGTEKKSIFDQKESQAPSEYIEQQMLVGNSLFLFSSTNRFRMFMFRFINNSQVVAVVILLILVSSVLLAIEDPLTESKNPVLVELDLVITILFTLEAGIKIISFGFVFNGQYSYMRDFANILDFIVIIFSLISITTDANLQIFKILRIFRVLRPLKLVSRNDSLKIAINALIYSIPKLLNLLLVCLVFYLLFSIFGVNFFKGSFFYCDIAKANPQLPIQAMADCFDYGGSWVNADYNFDNVIQGMQSLFVISTTEGWVDLMFLGVDSVGIGYQPIRNNLVYWSMFYVGFVIIGAFFMMNLFAGVVLDAFNSERDKLRGYFYLSLEQQEWVDVRNRIYYSKPQFHLRPAQNPFRASIFRLVTHPYFDRVLFVLIAINTIIFMVQHNRQPEILTVVIQYSNIGFLAVFTLELFLKLIAFGVKYFQESFNIFDFVVVIMTAIGAILEQLNLFTSVGTALSILRSFRIIRVMRLIRSARSLRLIFETFVITLPELANIGGLLTIILFMYGVMGMNLYAYIKRGNGITEQANFSSLLNSLFILFKCSTGENWNEVMADLSRSIQPNNVCFSELTYLDFAAHGFQGCGDWSGTVFMVSFQLVFSMIMLNLFVAVIVEGYDRIQKDDLSLVSSQHIAGFQEHWKLFDENATGLIRALDLHRFLIKLPRPLGWKGLLLTEITKRRIMNEYKLPVYLKEHCFYYSYHDLLEVLSHDILQRKFGQDTELEPKKQVKATKDLIKKKLELIESLKDTQTTNLTSHDVNSGFIIMRRMRNYMEGMKRRMQRHQSLIKQLEEVKSENEEEEEELARGSPNQQYEGTHRPTSSYLNTHGQLSAHVLNQTRNTSYAR